MRKNNIFVVVPVVPDVGELMLASIVPKTGLNGKNWYDSILQNEIFIAFFFEGGLERSLTVCGHVGIQQKSNCTY